MEPISSVNNTPESNPTPPVAAPPVAPNAPTAAPQVAPTIPPAPPVDMTGAVPPVVQPTPASNSPVAPAPGPAPQAPVVTGTIQGVGDNQPVLPSDIPFGPIKSHLMTLLIVFAILILATAGLGYYRYSQSKAPSSAAAPSLQATSTP